MDLAVGSGLGSGLDIKNTPTQRGIISLVLSLAYPGDWIGRARAYGPGSPLYWESGEMIIEIGLIVKERSADSLDVPRRQINFPPQLISGS